MAPQKKRTEIYLDNSNTIIAQEIIEEETDKLLSKPPNCLPFTSDNIDILLVKE